MQIYTQSFVRFTSYLFLLGATQQVLAEKAEQMVSAPLVGQTVEISRFSAEEARQGVAVDSDFIYVIGNHEIGKYDKASFERVAQWSCPEGQPLIHMNAGLRFKDKLYTAHSNYPEVPMLSSIEIFDPDDLRHLDTHSFGLGAGSLTWLAPKGNEWFGFFAHYANRAAEPNRNPKWSEFIRFDDQWRKLEGWAFPQAFYADSGRYSASGGAFGPMGYLYATGHDNPVLYVLDFPSGGSRMELIGKISIQAEGQAFVFDSEDPTVLYTILKRTREVIVERIVFDPEFENSLID